MPRVHVALLSIVLFLAARPAMASTFYVGSCHTGAYSTIGAAVGDPRVPAGSTIKICPQTYNEQVTISKPLILQGIAYQDQSQPVIAVPSGGLTTTSSISLGVVAAQVEVTAGPVNISGITVDGSASSNCPNSSDFFVGIFYTSGSSGTVNEVETRNQTCNVNGIGIAAENGAGTTQSITIENSNVSSVSNTGITAYSDQTPSTLNAYIKGNYLANFSNGIVPDGTVAGSVTGNFLDGGPTSLDVYGLSPSSPITGNITNGGRIGITLAAPTHASGNTVSGASYGIWLHAAAVASSNRVLNSGTTGIYLESPTASGSTVENNFITQTPYGIELNCLTGITISGNSINGAGIGLDLIPTTFSGVGVNKFYNVAVLADECGF